MRKQKTVALLVLNYNSKSFLRGCLDSLLEQNYKNFKIFVIDNCSTDGSVDFVKENYPQVNVVENSENFGVGKGFNDAIKTVSKEFDLIGLFNPDVKVDRNWLKESVSTLNNHSEAEICASLILDWTGGKVDTAGGMIVNFLAGIFGGFFGGKTVNEISPQYKREEFPVFFGVVTAMLVRANTFGKFGFFDEDYFMYFEDIDFSWRVLLGGGKIFCNPRAIVYHYGHGSKVTRKISLKLLKQTEINLLATYVKNLSPPSLIFITPSVIFFRLTASLFYVPISPKITWAKISGFILFLGKLLSGKYRKQRVFVSRIRKLTDREVLAFNPTPLVSFEPVLKVMRSWLKTIKKVYERS